VRVTGLTHTYADPSRAPGGLIFGYGQVPVSDIDPGVRAVAKVVDGLG
jgi:hypothetical protein